MPGAIGIGDPYKGESTRYVAHLGDANQEAQTMSFKVYCIVCDWSVTVATREQAREIAIDEGRKHAKPCGCYAVRVADLSRAGQKVEVKAP